MFHDKIKSFFSSAVDKTVSSISEYAVNPGRDFSRSRKLPPDRLITSESIDVLVNLLPVLHQAEDRV